MGCKSILSKLTSEGLPYRKRWNTVNYRLAKSLPRLLKPLSLHQLAANPHEQLIGKDFTYELSNISLVVEALSINIYNQAPFLVSSNDCQTAIKTAYNPLVTGSNPSLSSSDMLLQTRPTFSPFNLSIVFLTLLILMIRRRVWFFQ